jgi:hypothetical protein
MRIAAISPASVNGGLAAGLAAAGPVVVDDVEPARGEQRGERPGGRVGRPELACAADEDHGCPGPSRS